MELGQAPGAHPNMQHSSQPHCSQHLTQPQQAFRRVHTFGVNDSHDLSSLPYHPHQSAQNHRMTGFRGVRYYRNGRMGPPNRTNNRAQYKTVLCRWHTNIGFCYYGDRCRFAHGEKELRTHPLYKTKECRHDNNFGQCRNGSYCQFLHKMDIRDLPLPEEVKSVGAGMWSRESDNCNGAQCSFKGQVSASRAARINGLDVTPFTLYSHRISNLERPQQPATKERNLPPVLGFDIDPGHPLHQSVRAVKSFSQEQQDVPPGFGTQLPPAPRWNMFADSAGSSNMHDSKVQSYNNASGGNRVGEGIPTVDSLQMLSRGVPLENSVGTIWRRRYEIQSGFERQGPPAVSDMISPSTRRIFEHATPEKSYSFITDKSARHERLSTFEQHACSISYGLGTQTPLPDVQSRNAVGSGVSARKDIPVGLDGQMPATSHSEARVYYTQSSYMHGSSMKPNSRVDENLRTEVSKTGQQHGWAADSGVPAQMPPQCPVNFESNSYDRGYPAFGAPTVLKPIPNGANTLNGRF